MEIPSTRVIADAAERLRGVAHRTPVLTSRTMNQRAGAELFFKAEPLQRSGAFKFRGAWNALSCVPEEARRRGVITFSSGNHAAALALAGQIQGVKVVVALPNNSLPLKRAAVEGYGAEIVECTPLDREVVGRRVAAERGLHLIPPFDDWDVIAGQGTAALELLEDHPDLDIVLAPVGGGGLVSGTALAAEFHRSERGLARGAAVIGVEPEAANDAFQSKRSGTIVRLPQSPDTIADGLRPTAIGERTFAVISRHVSEIVTVSEAEILDAVRACWLQVKLVVEPSGAVPLAAVLGGRVDVAGRRVGLILSGGNADPGALGPLLS